MKQIIFYAKIFKQIIPYFLQLIALVHCAFKYFKDIITNLVIQIL